MSAPPTLENAEFQALADSLGFPVVPATPRSFELLFEGPLPVTVSMHPKGDGVSLEVWCSDLADLNDSARAHTVSALLQLNWAFWPGESCSISLDSRDFVLVHSQRSWAQLSRPMFGAWLYQTVEQGRRIQALVQTFQH